MKNYREIADSVFARRDQYVIAQRKKKQAITRVTASVGSVALVSLASFTLFKSDAFRETPPISDGGATTTTTHIPTEGEATTTTTTTVNTTAPTTDGGIVTPPTTAPTTTTGKTDPPKTTATTPSRTEPPKTTPSKTEPSKTNPTQPTATTVTTRPTQTTPTTGTKPTTQTTQTTQTTPTTKPTITDPSGEVPGDPLPPWPYLWIIYDMNANYANGEVPIYFKLEYFEEVPFDWVKETSYTAYGFSVVGDITVERDADTGAIIYRMLLAYDGVTRDPSFFFSVVTADGMKQTDGLYGYPAAHGFFVSPSYDSAYSTSVYYLVKTGVITFDEYQAIMEKYWSQFGFEFGWVETP